MGTTRSVDIVDGSLWKICVNWSTDEEVNHILRLGTDISEEEGLVLGE